MFAQAHVVVDIAKYHSGVGHHGPALINAHGHHGGWDGAGNDGGYGGGWGQGGDAYHG